MSSLEDPMPDYDVIVLGGGSAGTSAGRAAAMAGARTAVVNDGELGGLCILRGCMPTKAMLASAHVAHEARHTEPFGVDLQGQVVPRFDRIMARKDRLVERFKRAKVASVEAQEFDLLPGRASFEPGGGVAVNGRVLTARRYVIATGSVPQVPSIPGLNDVPFLTSDDVMKLTSPPASLVVYGAGPIGLELAQFFARIGVEVLLVVRSPLLHHYDLECGAELAGALSSEPNLELAVPATIDEVERIGSRVRVRIESEGRIREHRADALLMATGRRAALDGMGLEHVGLDPRGDHLSHDAAMRTENPDVFVAGDATGAFQILHLANQEGTVAGHNAAGVSPERTMDYRLKMSVVFTDPPFAHVGLTETEVEDERAGGREVCTSTVAFPKTGRAITMEVEQGLWKLVIDRASCEILGSAILGPRADDLIHLISLMMHYRGTVHDIPRLPWYHPTLSEVMINLGRDLAGRTGGCERPPAPPA
jgi:pyruvate/2-oxoglutarate dehydrogenase complex dihydrolipoamide dehydrogenase (E3) component